MGVTETAVLMHWTLTHVYNLLRLGRLPGAEKVNGEWRIPRQAVTDYLERRKRADVKLAA
jgi:excisionase family DNA binding protein